MSRRPSASRRETPAEIVYPVGEVAAMLGVPPITIRTWERRYGIGPSLRSRGQHRRYSANDVARLRRMISLIERGVSPVDAARLSARRGTTESEPDALLALAESYQVAALDELLDNLMDNQGIGRAWDEVITPAFQQLQQRFEDAGDCIDLAVLLAGRVDDAVERYIVRRTLAHGGDPCLLIPCPGEHHVLPLTILRAALLERGLPVVGLESGGNDSAILAAAERAHPSVIVLWTTMRRSGQIGLKHRLERLGHVTLSAGPGWPRPGRDVNSLDEAVDKILSSYRSTVRA